MEKFFCLQNEKSVLTRDESAFIKGVLICLVILWHNVFIASVFGSAYGIFVPAHVSGFFLITFLYGYKKTNFSNFIIKLSKKIIPIYAIAFIVCAVFFAIVYGAVLKNDAMRMSLEYVGAFFLGGIYVKEATGFLFFWFFPSFFCFSVWKFLLYSNTKLRMFLLVLSASFILYFNIFNGNCVSFSYANSIVSGLYFIFLAFLNNYILRKYNSAALFVVCLVLFAAFSASALFWGVKEIPDLIRAFFCDSVFWSVVLCSQKREDFVLEIREIGYIYRAAVPLHLCIPPDYFPRVFGDFQKICAESGFALRRDVQYGDFNVFDYFAALYRICKNCC